MSAEEPGFTEVYSRGYPRLVAELTLLTGSRAAAEDIAQDAYARAWARWPRIARLDDPVGWVRRVALNLAVSRWRRLQRAVRGQNRLAGPEQDAGPDPDWVDLRDELLRLPVRQRHALVLAAVSGLTTQEIATEMGVTESTVRSWLHRARRTVAGAPSVVPAAEGMVSGDDT